jgi:hypothetical protein
VDVKGETTPLFVALRDPFKGVFKPKVDDAFVENDELTVFVRLNFWLSKVWLSPELSELLVEEVGVFSPIDEILGPVILMSDKDNDVVGSDVVSVVLGAADMTWVTVPEDEDGEMSASSMELLVRAVSVDDETDMDKVAGCSVLLSAADIAVAGASP